jgi:hypothetical protein
MGGNVRYVANGGGTLEVSRWLDDIGNRRRTVYTYAFPWRGRPENVPDGRHMITAYAVARVYSLSWLPRARRRRRVILIRFSHGIGRSGTTRAECDWSPGETFDQALRRFQDGFSG